MLFSNWAAHCRCPATGGPPWKEFTAASVVCTALAVVAAIPTTTHASVHVDVGSVIRLGNGIGDTGGGRFIVNGTNSSGETLDTFETYCVETGVNQYVSYNTPYTVAAIGLQTSGKPGDPGTIRTLTPIVAWAYTAFRTGNTHPEYGLKNFIYASNPQGVQSANALQYLIWGNLASPYAGTLASTLRTTWQANFEKAVNDGKWAADDVGNVRIMQLIDAGGNTKQDQLVLIPEAATITIWGTLACLGLAFGYRRTHIG